YVFTKYDSILTVNPYWIVVSQFGKIGMINYSDEWIVPAKFESILLFNNQKTYALFWQGNRETYWWK
ncbi:MAG: hypothetical protein SNJ77_11605, partial [Cytophagales bacterium]